MDAAQDMRRWNASTMMGASTSIVTLAIGHGNDARSRREDRGKNGEPSLSSFCAAAVVVADVVAVVGGHAPPGGSRSLSIASSREGTTVRRPR